MDRVARIIALREELPAMPEYDLLLQLQGFDISIYTFDKNYHDLARLIGYLTTDERAESLYRLRNHDRLMLAMQDVIRLTHNYVASAMSLIDHTRRLYQSLYEKDEKFPDYVPKVAEFARDPLSQFVKCLRQYCQHYKAPNLDVTTRFERLDQRPSRTFSLLKADLMGFDGWSATAKRYLDAVNEKVDVLELASAYRNKVITFHQWFHARQREIHAEELRRFREKETELVSLELDEKLDMDIAVADPNSQHRIPHRADEVFTSIFGSREFNELDRIPRDSPERPLRAIQLLEERFFPVSDSIKEKILRLYELPDRLPGSDNEP